MRLTPLIAAAALCVLLACAPGVQAEECADVPRFLAMYGRWESVAVRAEPASILEDFPHWKEPNSIIGRPTEVCPGIRFTVRQESGDGIVTTALTWVFDQASQRSYGVIVGSDGSRLRGEMQHFADHDTLTLLDFSGRLAWRETHVWRSPGEFESVGVFDYHGAPGRVWFRTYRAAAR